jgi:LPS sulfotransferase NodH
MTQQSNPGRTRAVILTTQRTGSTFLVECLDSHPQVECASEILIGAADRPAPEYRGRFKQVAKVVRMFKSGAWRPGHRMEQFYADGSAPVRVFKVMYNQLANPFASRYLQQNEDIRILHLRRHNLLKVHVSKLLMPKRARVQAFEPTSAVQIHVDPAEAIASMQAARALYSRYDQLFARHPRLPLAYEELIDGNQLQAGTAARVCDFLGIEQHAMSSRLVKLNPESLREMVTNYDELADAVRRSEFADLLE